MMVTWLKIKLLALVCGAMLLQAGSCTPAAVRPFGQLTQTGGSLLGLLFVPQLPD
jgi:hypothetical protein